MILPLIPGMIAGLAFLIGLAIWFGRKERRRIGHVKANEPTAFTHTHRGNRPVGGDKFIATSWILFQSAQALYGGD